MDGNMTDAFYQFVHNLNTNESLTLLGTVSILALGFSELVFHPIGNWVSRPKLKFKVSIDDQYVEYDKDLWRRITFWIEVKNEGKSMASQSRAFLKLTDESGSINVPRKISFHSSNQFIPISWNESGKDKDVVNILPNDEFSSYVKIPLRIDFPERLTIENQVFQKGKFLFEDPIQIWNYLATSKDPQYAFVMKVEIKINYNDNDYEKDQFIIRIKNTEQISREDFEIFPFKKKSRFSFLGTRSESPE
jgi:hypothetical protein